MGLLVRVKVVSEAISEFGHKVCVDLQDPAETHVTY